MASITAATFEQASAPPPMESAFPMEEPPKYSEIVPRSARYNRSSAASHPASETTRLYQSEQATVARQQPTRQQPNVARRQQEVDTSDDHLCCWWYLAVGAFGAAGATLPFVIFIPDDISWNSTVWQDSTPSFRRFKLEYAYIYHFILFEVAGAACLILLIMWCFTVIFFRFNHPNKECYESKFRFRKTVNTGPIVCCFMIACFLFGSVTVAMMRDIINTCNFFTPPIYQVDCYLFFPTGNNFMWYAIINTSAMTAVMFGFLCLNCLCYCTCVRPNAGHVFC